MGRLVASKVQIIKVLADFIELAGTCNSEAGLVLELPCLRVIGDWRLRSFNFVLLFQGWSLLVLSLSELLGRLLP